jgi:hypothetical protein
MELCQQSESIGDGLRDFIETAPIDRMHWMQTTGVQIAIGIHTFPKVEESIIA